MQVQRNIRLSYNPNNVDDNFQSEAVRYIISHYACIFKNMFERSEDWEGLKQFCFSRSFAQLPIAKDDNDKDSIGTMSLARYLSQHVGLGANDHLEEVEINLAIYFTHQLRLMITGLYCMHANRRINRAFETIDNSSFHKYPTILSSLVNNGHFANSRLSFADLYFVAAAKYIVDICGGNIFETYPELISVIAKVESMLTIMIASKF